MRTLILLLFLGFTALTESSWGDPAAVQGAGVARVTLEGDWRPYQVTPLTVKRAINIERDGEGHLAEVSAPVLVRRGAVFLDPSAVAEILQIRGQVDELRGEIVKIQQRSRELADQYSKVIERATGQIGPREETEISKLGGVILKSTNHEIDEN